MEYRYTKVGKFENSLTLNGWEIPLTKKAFFLAYSGILKAGVDLTQATVDVHNHTIVVTLEDVEILTHTIDEESIEVYDEDKNIFNPISINDYKAFAIQQKTMVEEEVIEDGILSEAATKTKQVIEKCFNMIPSVKENYQIEITFKKV